jgi:hypothetical protein
MLRSLYIHSSSLISKIEKGTKYFNPETKIVVEVLKLHFISSLK